MSFYSMWVTIYQLSYIHILHFGFNLYSLENTQCKRVLAVSCLAMGAAQIHERAFF